MASEAYHDWSGEAADAQLRVNFTLKLLMNCRKNDRNGRRQLVVLVEVSSLLLLRQVATASKSVWMVYLLGSELGSLLRHGNPYCTLCPLPSFTAIRLNRAPFPPFAICHPEVNDVISQLRIHG